MSLTTRFAAFANLTVLLLALLVLSSTDARAQDDATAETPAACDSTLVLLLVVAEHDYRYLSEMENPPNLDFGQYARVVEFLVSRTETTAMTDEQSTDQNAMQAVINMMMTMTTSTMLAQDFSMGINAVGGEMTTLQPGNIPDETEVCATLRADVEQFLTAHIVAEMQMAAFDDSPKLNSP